MVILNWADKDNCWPAIYVRCWSRSVNDMPVLSLYLPPHPPFSNPLPLFLRALGNGPSPLKTHLPRRLRLKVRCGFQHMTMSPSKRDLCLGPYVSVLPPRVTRKTLRILPTDYKELKVEIIWLRLKPTSTTSRPPPPPVHFLYVIVSARMTRCCVGRHG